jgi:hypothetical protein
MPANATSDPDLMLAEDMGRFYADPLGFVLYAYEWGVGDLRGHDGPDVWQQDFLNDIGRQVKDRGFDGVTAVEPIRKATSSGHGIGKSALTAWLVNWIVSTRPHCKGVVTANTSPQLETKTWAEVAKWTRRCITGHWFDVSTGKGSMRLVHKGYPESWRVDAQTCREENSESFAGLHAANSTPFYIFDEASAIPERIWEVGEGGMTDGEPMWFVFGNPTRNTGKFFECFNRQRHRWHGVKIDSRTAKMPNKKQIQEWVDDYGEDSDFVRIRVKGEFPRAGSCQFIASDIVEGAVSREVEVPQGSPKLFGVDVARFGDDQSVILRRHGRKVEEIHKFRGLDTMELSAKVAEYINIYKPDHTFIDEVGVGAGVVDRLKQLGYSIIPVNSANKADDERQWSNKRAEMWGRMKEWLGGADIPADQELESDLVAPEYGYDAKMRVQLEKKSDMKKRGMASPDCADSLALTFAYPTPPLKDISTLDLLPEWYEDF